MKMIPRETPVGIINNPEQLNDDDGKLLSPAEKAILAEAITRAQYEPDGAIILDATNIGCNWLGVNLNLAQGARWVLSRPSGKVGGYLNQARPVQTPVQHQQRIHHHELPAEHIFHGGKW